jgi:hypothetical protein
MSDSSYKKLNQLEKTNLDSKCLISIDSSAIDIFSLHFKLDKLEAIAEIMRSIANKKPIDSTKTDSFFQIKIPKKPIILWVFKTKNWRQDRYRILICLKPSFLAMSVEGLLDELTDKAIHDALGV